ncbi:la-related protein 6-like [Parus major]|uniref:la-related protein 6-like n=1 Tax=Parus major TaxID=9157 RepID=UPI00077136F0|nr:la-related protein 6-like [Parus major]
MSARGSAAALGLSSQPSCSTPVPAPRNSLLAQPVPPPRSCSLALLGQEDIVESYSGNSCELGVALLDCSCSAPDPQLVRRIVAQVEFYLSDENLAKDTFLLKHVQKNKMGFVSIKLLTSFKKVKYLTRDWRLTLYALKFSALLEVNKEGTKVRRRLPIPEHLLSVPPSKLLAWELQPRQQELLLQETFLETIARMFSPFGAIASIRLLRPGRKLPSDVRRYSGRFPELLSRCCALVEYESLESAHRAFESLGHRDWHGVRVVRLCGKGGKKKGEEERAGWKGPEAAPSFPRSLGASLASSSPESDDDASGSLSLLLKQDLLAPTWPGGDFTPGNSSAFPGSLLPGGGWDPLGLGLGTESRRGSAEGSWTPWASGLCPAASAPPS